MSLIARLIEAGTPSHLVEEVAMELARARVVQEILDARRASDRERQSRRRHVTSREVTDVTGCHEPPPPTLDKETSPTPPKEINPTTPTTGTTRARRAAFRLPDDWKPAKLDRGTVSGQIVENRGQEWARRTLESFKNHWRSANGPNARKLDWQATFANWVIEQDRRDGNGKSNGMGGHREAGEARIIAAGRRFVSRGSPPPQHS